MLTTTDRRSASEGAPPRTIESGANDDAVTETVLVVEDNAAVRTIVQRMLGSRGYAVLTAADGQEALAILHSARTAIDIVLCDIVMPDLSGSEIVRRIQARSGDTRALFMSGHASQALTQDGKLGIGAAFIQKPFTPSSLARKLREVLDA